MSFAVAAGDAVLCPHCGNRLRVHFGTDFLTGKLVEHVEQCLCPEARRLAGICRDCLNPVEGKVGKALRCAVHKQEARREYCRRWRERHPDRVKAIQERENAKRRTELGRARRRLYEREYRNRPEVKERRRLQRRRRAIANPEAKREQHRRYRERYPERVKEQQRRANAKRAAAKREYMHRYMTKYVGPGLKPKCRKCGGEVPWPGRGRPRLECPTCDPKRWRRDQTKTARARKAAAPPTEEEA